MAATVDARANCAIPARDAFRRFGGVRRPGSLRSHRSSGHPLRGVPRQADGTDNETKREYEETHPMEMSLLIRWLLASLHLLGFGLALTAIIARTRALRRCGSAQGLAGVFLADNVWGLSALLLIVTGSLRAFGGFEKGASFYLQEPFFHVKMGALVLILLLEIAPMIALIRWRIALRKGISPPLARVHQFAAISAVQVALLIVIVFAAAGMARGVGMQGTDW
jgi:putative membrane protein